MSVRASCFPPFAFPFDAFPLDTFPLHAFPLDTFLMPLDLQAVSKMDKKKCSNN